MAKGKQMKHGRRKSNEAWAKENKHETWPKEKYMCPVCHASFVCSLAMFQHVFPLAMFQYATLHSVEVSCKNRQGKFQAAFQVCLDIQLNGDAVQFSLNIAFV